MGKIYGEDVPVRPAFPDAVRKSKGAGKSKAGPPTTGDTGLLLYIHVPFCRSRCHYCTFHSQAFNQVTFAWYHKLLLEEIRLWGARLKKPLLRTVYFGGGTPSLIPLNQLQQIMKALDSAFILGPAMEVTLEANPDSATDVSYFRALLSMGVNRLSLGVQSLSDADLHALGRPHSAAMAYASYDSARQAGFGNIGLDFIWGLPGQRLKPWIDQLTVVTSMRPEHISAYNLTLEPDTPMAALCAGDGPLTLPPDKEQGRMFIYGAEYLESMGYMHYEVSNFARMGFVSKHNSGYWSGADYLGLGPSAVSTIGRRRFENPRYMDEYDAYVRGGLVGRDHETLSDADLLREMVMLSLRTAKGLDLKEFRKRAGYDLVKRHERLVTALHRENLVRISHGFLRLTKNGMLVSNVIIRRLAFDDEQARRREVPNGCVRRPARVDVWPSAAGGSAGKRHERRGEAMRIAIPKVHGRSPREKLIRTLALILIFAVVAWAFMKNNERVLETLNREGAIYDETGTLDEAQKKFIVSFTRALKSEYGMNCRIQIFGGDFVVPELDAKTMYIGLAPAIGVVELRFPPMMRQALGADFIESLKTEHLLPSFATNDWPMEIQIVLAAIFEKLSQLEGGAPGE